MTSKKSHSGLRRLADIDRIIHEPSRLMILTQLFVLEKADFIFIQNQTGLTQGNLSSHLTKLETAEYIEVKKEFVGKKPHTLIQMTDLGRSAFMDYILNMKGVFSELHSLSKSSK